MQRFSLIPYNSKHNSVLPSSSNNLLLINPVAMKCLNLKKGSCVLVNTAKEFLLLKSWPVEFLDSSDVTLPAYSLLGNSPSQVFIEPFYGSVLEATCVILSPVHCNDNLSDPRNLKAFKNFLKNELGECYIRQGMDIKPSYHFSHQTFFVKQVLSFNEHASLNKTMADIEVSKHSFSDSRDILGLEESFDLKCKINVPGSTKSSQCSTPISSPDISFKKKSSLKQSKLSKMFTEIKDIGNFYSVTSKTNFVIEFTDFLNESSPETPLHKIQGLKKQLDLIISRINTLFCSDLKPLSRGLLISGPSGSGKSLVISALQDMYKHQLTTFVLDEYTKCRSKSLYLRKIFKEATNNLPCIIFLEDLCKSGKRIEEEDKSLRFELPSMIYNLINSTPHAMVIATCRTASSVFEGLRKRGILDEEICFPVPFPEDRKQILSSFLKRFRNELTSSELSEVVVLSHGYDGDDLKNLCRKAHHLCTERGENTIKFTHLVECAKLVKPKSMTEFSFKVPNVKWEDVGGMENIKRTIIEMVEWPLKYPEKLKHFQIKVPRGVLMYGPPGCCKTMIVKALASESNLNFINVRTSQVFGKYVGDSEKSVSELFRKARSAAPCILFMDEIDSLASKRGSSHGNSNVSDRVLTQLLIEIDGVDVLEQGIYVIAATNRPDNIDPSLLRPGRFDRMIYVPLPNESTRKDIFEVILKKIPLSSDIDQPYLISKTEGYTGAEIAQICSSACVMAIKENPISETNVLTMAHLLKALMSVQPRTTKEMIKTFEEYHEKQLLNSL